MHNRIAPLIANGKRLAVAVVPTSLALVSTGAFAQAGTDFSSILDGLSVTTMVTAVLAAATLIAVVGFAVWGAKKLARFFG